jgi:WD40 repeat protein
VNQDRAVALAVKGAEMYGSDALPPEVRDVLFRAATSPVSLALVGQEGPTTTAAISLDGSVVVAAGRDDIQIWERETGRALAQLPLGDGEKVNSVDLTADGSTVIAGMDNGTLLAWNVADNQPLRWPDTTGFVWAVAMSPDGSSFASAGLGAVVHIWDLDRHLLTTVQDPNSSYTNSVAFTPDGKFLATTGDNADVVLWDVNSGAQGATLKLPEEAWVIAFGTDGNSLASISANAVIVWDLDRWVPRYPPFRGAPGTSRNIDYDFRRALSVNERGGVSVYDLANGEETMSASVPGASSWGAVFDLDPDRVLVVGNDVDPSFWNLRPAGASEILTAVAVTDDRIFQAWSDGTLWSSSPDAYDSERVVPGISIGDVKELSADRDGARLAAVTNAGGVRVWDTMNGSEPIVLKPADALFSDVALTPDGTVLVTGDEAGVVSAWDPETGEKLADVAAATSVGGGWPRAVTELQLSPDGSTVFAALQPYVPGDPIALMAPLSGGGLGSERALLMPEGWEAEIVEAATFSADGESVILGTDKGRIGTLDGAIGDLVWDAGTTHDGRVQELLTTESDGMVLSMGADNRVMVLDTANQKKLGHVASGSIPLAAVLKAQGQEMVLVTQNQGIVTVRMDDSGLLALVGSKVINTAE